MSPSGTPRYEPKFMEKPRCYGSGFCESSRQKCGHYRVHGYRFCIWHILEDHEAPYKQCDHVENLTNVRCQFSVYLKTRDPRFCQMHSTMKENFAGLKRKQPMKQSSALGEFSVVVMAASVAHHVDIMERGSLSDSAPGDFVSDKGLRFDCRPAKRLKKEHVVCLDPSDGGTHRAGDAGQDSSPSAFSAERKGSRKSSKFLESLPLSASPPFLMADSAGQDHAGVTVGGAVDIGPVELTRVGLCSVSRVARAVKWQQVDMERLDLSGSGCLSRDCGNDSSSKKRGSAQRGLSKFVGVRRRPWGTYGAEICTPEGRVWLGTFDTEALAASAYDDAARLIRGTGTSTNFGEGSEDVELPLAWPQSDMQEEQDVSAEQGSAVKPAAPAASAMAVEPVPGSAGERMLESHPETSTETEMDTEMDTQGRGLQTPTIGISRTHHQSLLKPPHQPAAVNTARSTGRQSKPIDCSSVEKYVQESRSLGVRRINTGRYEASVYNKLTKKMIYVGRFDTREEAVTARDRVIANVIVDSNKHKGSSPGTAAHQKPDEAPGQSGAKSRTHTGKGGLSNQKLVSEPETGPARRRHRKKVPSAAAGFSLGDPGLLRTPNPGQVPRDLKTSHGSADRSLGVQAAGGRSASDLGRANALAVPKTSGGDHKLFGVTKKWSTGRYEASFYDRNEKRKVYVGMFETDLEAACARDQLAVQCGATSHLNFPEWAASAQKDKGPIPLASRESPKPVAGLKANKGSGARDRAVKIAHWLKRKSGHVDLNSVPSGGSGDSIPYAVPPQEIAQDDHSIPFALPPEEASQYDRSVPYADPPQQISQSDHSNFSDDYTASEEADSEDFASDASDSGYENARLKRFSKSADRSRLKRKRGSMLHHDNSLSSSGDELLSEDGQEFNQQHPQGEHTPGDDFRRRRTSSGLSTDTVDEYMFQDLKSEYGRIYKTTSKRRAMLGQSRLNHGPKDDAGNSVRSPAGESDEQAEGIGSRPQIDSCTGLEKRLQGTSSIKNQRHLGTGPDSGKDGAGRLDLKRAPRRCPYIGVQATAGGRFKSKMYLAATKQHIYVGTFDSAVDAAKAYDDMVFKRSGNIKRLNFPERYGLNLPAAKKQRVKTRKKVVVGQASDDRQWRPSSASNVKSLAQQSGKLPEEEEGKAYSGSKYSQKFEVQNDEAYDEDHEVKTRSISADDSPFVVKIKPLVESADLPADDEKKRRQRKPGKTLHRHYKGVYSNGMKFKCIYYNPLAKRHTYLGSFVTAEEAARVYDQLWFWQFGESPNLKLSPEELLPRSASCYHPLSGGTGEYYGVCETGGLYHAMFYNDRNHLPFYCGNFKSAIDAAHAYDKAAFKELGAAAVLNFPKNFEDRLPKTSTWSTAGGEQQSGAIEHNIEARFEAFEGGNGDSARREKLAVRRDVTKLK